MPLSSLQTTVSQVTPAHTPIIDRNAGRVDVNQRKIINGGGADVVQLWPIKHKFAWEAYNVGNANH